MVNFITNFELQIRWFNTDHSLQNPSQEKCKNMKTDFIWWQHKQEFGVTYFPLELHLHSPYASVACMRTILRSKLKSVLNTPPWQATLWLLLCKFYQLSQNTSTGTDFIDGSKTFARRSRSILYYTFCFQCYKFWVNKKKTIKVNMIVFYHLFLLLPHCS